MGGAWAEPPATFALHAASEPGLVLTLGYNTAAFGLVYRLKGVANLIKMAASSGGGRSGARWSGPGCVSTSAPAVGWANHLIADYPEIKATVSALRFHSSLYVHCHQLGGTNPSLVEALGAGSPVLAHCHRFVTRIS